VHQAKYSGRACKAAQLTGGDEKANVVLRRRYNLCRCQLVLSQHIFNHRVKRKPKVTIEDCAVDHDALS